MPANTTCFVISPIGEPDSPTRKRSDQVLKYIIRPAAEECGFTALRADEISETGIITSQVIQHVIEDAVVVADLTGSNANVFYELAIRHAIRRPYVQIIDESDPLPFDVAGIRTIPFTHRDLDSVDSARKEVVKHIRSMTATDANVESPITAAVDLNNLKRSQNPEDRHLGEVLIAISELKQQVTALQRHTTIPVSLTTSSPYISGKANVTIPLSTLVGVDLGNAGRIIVPPELSQSILSNTPLTVSTGPIPLVAHAGSVVVSSDVDKSILGASAVPGSIPIQPVKPKRRSPQE
jgi:hypothetical protein